MNLWEKYQCPGCDPAVKGNERQHSSTCPIGISLDETQEQDAQYFIDHPDATEYYRPIALCDQHNLMLTLPPGTEVKEWVGEVRIIQISPGLRMRSYADIFGILDQNADIFKMPDPNL